MTIVFEDAEPTTGPEAPNPYTDVVASIAGKFKEGTTIPLAKSFWHPAPTTDDITKKLNKIIRDIQEAAKSLNVTAKKDISSPEARDLTSSGYKAPIENEPTGMFVKVTFWTVPPLVKTRRTKAEIEAAKNKADSADKPAMATPAKTVPAKKAASVAR